MTLNHVLDSSIARQQRTDGREVPNYFTINFQPSFYLGPDNYKSALNRLVTMGYTWYNIDASFDNNKIRWGKTTEEWRPLIFPNGMYDYSEFNSFLQSQTGKDKRYSDLSFQCKKTMNIIPEASRACVEGPAA